jgi:hypothetical protein
MGREVSREGWILADTIWGRKYGKKNKKKGENVRNKKSRERSKGKLKLKEQKCKIQASRAGKYFCDWGGENLTIYSFFWGGAG